MGRPQQPGAFLAALAGIPVCTVLVRCDLAVAERRERDRHSHDGIPLEMWGRDAQPAGGLRRCQRPRVALCVGIVRTSVRVGSLTRAADVAARVVAAAGRDADEHLWLDIRRDRLVITLQSQATAAVTAQEVELAHRISAVVRELGLATDAEVAASRGRTVLPATGNEFEGDAAARSACPVTSSA
jgi:hypothetical protein